MNEPNELGAGVQILIDQLKNNPDDFFGPVGEDVDDYQRQARPAAKFRRWCSIIEDDLVQVNDPREKLRTSNRHTWFMTEPEKEALREAYCEAKRLRFDAEIIAALHAKPEDFRTGNYVLGGAITSGVIAQPVGQQVFRTHGNEVMRLDASGELSIGAASGSAFSTHYNNQHK